MKNSAAVFFAVCASLIIAGTPADAQQKSAKRSLERQVHMQAAGPARHMRSAERKSRRTTRTARTTRPMRVSAVRRARTVEVGASRRAGPQRAAMTAHAYPDIQIRRDEHAPASVMTAPVVIQQRFERRDDYAGDASAARATAYAGHGATFGSTALVSEARQWLGTNPTNRRTLWCGAFMNFVLERSGYRRGPSDLARSFAAYGTRVSVPQVGAIAVMARGGGGHVGVVSGFDESGDPIIISGNNGNTVREAAYPRRRIYAYVMPAQ
jgi:uncharacterized protein (TIGR02594 family)